MEQQIGDVKALVDPSSKLAQVGMIALDHETSSHAVKLNFLTDSVVNRTLLSKKIGNKLGLAIDNTNLS